MPWHSCSGAAQSVLTLQVQPLRGTQQEQLPGSTE